MRLRNLAMAGLLLPLITGCSGLGTALLKQAREKENWGSQVKGDVSWMIPMAQKVLQDRGYVVTQEKNYKGPDSAGFVVWGSKRQTVAAGDLGANVAANIGLGMLGAKDQHIRASTGDLVGIYIQKKWNETTWDKADPDMVVMKIGGSRYDKDIQGNEYNVQAINRLDIDPILNEVVRMAQSTVLGVMSPPPATSAAPAPSALFRGAELEKQGKNLEAIAAYNEAIKANNNDKVAWRALGNLYFKQKQKPEAVRCFEQVQRLNPSDASFKAWLDKYKAG